MNKLTIITNSHRVSQQDPNTAIRRQQLHRLLCPRNHNLLARPRPRLALQSRHRGAAVASAPNDAPLASHRIRALRLGHGPRRLVDMAAGNYGNLPGRLLRHPDGRDGNGLSLQRDVGADVLGLDDELSGHFACVRKAGRYCLDGSCAGCVYCCAAI